MAVAVRDAIDPRGADWITWSSRLVEILFATGSPPLPPSDERGWREWAVRLFENRAFQGLSVPRPDAFDDWREWGEWVKGFFP